MSEKLYIIACTQDLQKMGLDRIRMRVEGMERRDLRLDWSKTSIVPVVADEKVSFQVGETRIVNIRPIDVNPDSIVLSSMFGVNGMGHMTCIGSTEFKQMTEKRIADKAMFQSRIKAPVMPGDILGQVIIVEAE